MRIIIIRINNMPNADNCPKELILNRKEIDFFIIHGLHDSKKLYYAKLNGSLGWYANPRLHFNGQWNVGK